MGDGNMLPLAQHLVDNKRHWEASLRELAAKSLGKLAAQAAAGSAQLLSVIVDDVAQFATNGCPQELSDTPWRHLGHALLLGLATGNVERD